VVQLKVGASLAGPGKQKCADMTEIELTDRERLVAKEAAKLALEELSSEFYKKVGKTVVEKVLIWIGLLAAGYFAGKGLPFRV
jgi:hypothetical protein